MTDKLNIKWISITLFIFLNILIWTQPISFGKENILKVVFLDVGQGDAVFIETRSGNQVLVDGGPNDKVLRELSKIMSLSDKSIDLIIATHPDSDHIGGLVSVVDRFDSSLFLESGSKSETLVYSSLEESLEKSNLRRVIARKGMIFDLGDNVLIRVLFPDRDVSNVDPNVASIILKIEHGDISFMLSGDAPSSIEKYLASILGNNLESDVLKAGHHGSKTSTAEIFLGFVDPEYSIISAGEDNKYGHPHAEVLERLYKVGAEVLATAEEGSITFISDSKTVIAK